MTVAGRYVLGERLGVGGMAQVFRAEDTLLGRQVAVKLFGPSVDPHAPDRVRGEMRTAAGLAHPGLVTLYDAGTDEPGGGAEPRAFLVMQLIDGMTLGQLIAAGPVPPDRVALLGAALADALGYVHSRGVVHRDIKPANVLLDAHGAPYLVDFGIAQTLGQSGHTQTGFTVGTAAFLSPEQVLGGRVGPPADVYCLGLVLLEALTGRREYPGLTAETAMARLSRPPRVDPRLPAPWPGLLTAMTRSDPAERPTAPAVAAVLRGEHSLPTAPASADTPTVLGANPTALLPPAPDRDHTRVLPDRTARRAVPRRPVPRRAASARPGPAGRAWASVRNDRRRLLAAATVAVLLLVVAVAAVSSLGGPPSSTAPAPASTASPGPDRLDTDLNRLRDLVSP